MRDFVTVRLHNIGAHHDLSHEHCFIFLKTKKTAVTAIEAALSQLCGAEDVITPFREASESERQGRGQNYRIDHSAKPKRPLLKRLLRRPERYYHHPSVGFYEHMPARTVREDIWRSYFKFSLELVGPAGIVVLLQDQVEGRATELRELHVEQASRLHRQPRHQLN